ncbi:MAG: fumarylacetoacetate hydrolase family protein [Chloroflexi bacterium]|nr:fumarylacetoacetate hydrolase family protein [Chloroflexota bacterium]
MRIARVRVGRRTSYARVSESGVHLVRGGLFGALEPTGESHPLGDVRLLSPVRPGKIVAMAVNYASHAQGARGQASLSPIPQPFLKTPSSIVGPQDPIVLPPDAGRVDEEAEVVVVIGRRARAISEQEVDDHIFGYTAGNDVSARHWQRDDTQWWRAKSANSFSPIGPWVETEIPHGSDIRLVGRVNGEVVQEAHTGELVHSIRRSIAFISQYMTLERGDLLFTGTPGTTVELKPGDVVEVEVEGVGVLSNPVVAGAP